MQFHPRLVIGAVAAIRLFPELARNHALDAAIVTVNDFRTSHTRENLNAQFLGLLRHPAADIAHRDNVVAVIVHQGRHREVGNTDFARLTQHVEIVVLDRRVQRRAFFFPVGNQRIQTAGIQHRA